MIYLTRSSTSNLISLYDGIQYICFDVSKLDVSAMGDNIIMRYENNVYTYDYSEFYNPAGEDVKEVLSGIEFMLTLTPPTTEVITPSEIGQNAFICSFTNLFALLVNGIEQLSGKDYIFQSDLQTLLWISPDFSLAPSDRISFKYSLIT